MDDNYQNFIRNTLQQLEYSINSSNTEAAIDLIDAIISNKFPCKYQITNMTPSNLRPDIMEQLLSTGTITKRVDDSYITENKNPNEQDSPLDGTISMGRIASISEINNEIFEKLKKNNPVAAAKYAATGVSNMKEALVKLKEYSRKK